LVACNDKKPKTTTITSEDGKEKVIIDHNNIQNMAVEMKKKKEELAKLTPLTNDELKALLPETLSGTPRTDLKISNAMGAGLAHAKYKMNDSMELRLDIYDCAGTAGASIYSMQYLTMWGMQEETETSYTKTIDFNGGKAFEHCKKLSNNCTLTYFAGGRFLVVIDGRHMGIDPLKQAAGELGLK
jgi:hypothetical protein